MAAANQSRLEAILNNAVDAIVTIDERGIIDSVNPATERLFGYTADELIGKNVNRLMPSPHREKHDSYLENYKNGGPPQIIGIGREVPGCRKDGSIFPMHLAVSEFDDQGRRMFAGIVRDISDLKKAETELKRLNDELEIRVRERTEELKVAQDQLLKKEKLATLGQVSGGIAHEIRNPLNAVKTSTYYLIHAKNPSEEKTKEHLSRIDRQVTLIDNVVTALSDVAKLPPPVRQPTSLSLVLQNVLKSVELPPEIEVQWKLPDDLPEVSVDEFQIPLVFKNLIRNARDAMPDGGQLTISAIVEKEWVQLTVQDSGCGISNDTLGRIFEPLFSTKARGMGLGLAITKAIVEKNDGQLDVQSEVGVGSKFIVRLQCASKQ